MGGSSTSGSGADLLLDVAGSSPSRAAVALAILDFPVFPVHSADQEGSCSCDKTDCRDVAKHPRTLHGLLDATTDEEQIEAWWSKWPDANVAVATGAASDFWVLDIDPAHGGLATFEQLEARHGLIAETWCVETGGDGLHLWFDGCDGSIRNSAGRLGPGLDVRANGGYIIVPPSRHRSSASYQWTPNWHPTVVALAPAPSWLIELAHRASAPRMIPPDPFSYKGDIGGNHFNAGSTVIMDGTRNDTLTSIAGAMRRRGCTESVILAALVAENVARCAPPLPEDEVARIARSVSRYVPTPVPTSSRRPSRPPSVEFVDGKAVVR